MKISEIKQRLSTAGSFNAIIGNYIYAFLTARPFTPGYDLIGEGVFQI